MKCPHCQGEHPDDAKFCPVSGRALETGSAPEHSSRSGHSNLPMILLIGLGVVLMVVGAYLIWQPYASIPFDSFDAATQSSPSILEGTPDAVTSFSDPTATPTLYDPWIEPSATLTPFPTNTPFASATPVSGTPWPACSTTYLSRLRTGGYATVSTTPPYANNVRSSASINATLLGKIQPGERIKILDGPECAGGWVWWKIESQKSGLTGWTSEGDEEDYWLVPEE